MSVCPNCGTEFSAITSDKLLSVRLPGLVHEAVLTESCFGDDDPAEHVARAALKRARVTRMGKGTSCTVSLAATPARALLDHCAYEVETLRSLTNGDLGDRGWSKLRAFETAVDRLRAACE